MPAWLPSDPTADGRQAVVEASSRALAGADEVAIVGPPGSGKTAVAGALATTRGPVLAVRLAGAEDEADALRMLGQALGVIPRADEVAIDRALLDHESTMLVAIEVSNDSVLAPLRRLRGERKLLVTSETPLLAAHVEVPDGMEHGIRVLASAMNLRAGAVVDTLAANAAWLAPFPAGLPGDAGIPPHPAACVPHDDGRWVLRPLVRAALRARGGAAPTPDGTKRARAALAGALAVAVGGHHAAPPDARDVLALRALGAGAGTDRAAILCRAAAARLVAASGQRDVARSMLAEARADAFSRAILGWARADLALDEGRADAAVAAFDRAAAELARAGLPELRADLLRRAAERLCVRGEALPAEDAWRRARAAYRKADLRTGVAACLRGSADLAVSTGAWISAGALQEEIEDAPADGLEMENRRLGAASQCLARGELARAEAMLAVSIAGAEDDALWRANVLRRRADVLLRRGQHASAMLAADEAAKRYAEANEGVAQAAALRLGADVAAAAGRLSEARARYREATLLHVRVGDLRGLCRTLGNAAGVEESIGNVEGVRRLRQQRAAVMQLSTE